LAFALYFDDDSESRAVVLGLVALGHDVVRSTDKGMRGRPDAEHLAFATVERRALFTANRVDFLRLHAEWLSEHRTHNGIVILTQQRYSSGEQIRRLRALLAEFDTESMVNRLEYLSNWG
jgi:hypothetical protein